MFIARRNLDDSVTYRHRVTGVRYVISKQPGCRVSLYAEGRYIFSSQSRRAVLEHLEAIA